MHIINTLVSSANETYLRYMQKPKTGMKKVIEDQQISSFRRFNVN